MRNKNELVIFETKDNAIRLEVPVENETVWLTQAQMVELFDRDQSVISRHINNAFKEELDKDSNMQKMHIANSDKPVAYYSLDVVISVGQFLYFLDKNGVLFINDEKMIDDHTLVALTIMIAESKPEEKEMMITVIMNCLRS